MTRPTAGNDVPSENPTQSTPETERAPRDTTRPLQFDVQSLLWLTVTIAVALMYLRGYGHLALLQAVLVITVALAAGLVVGTMRNRVGEVLYWSVLGSAFAFLSTVGGRLAHWTTPFAWAGVGLVTGCAVAGQGVSPWRRCVAAGGLAAGLVMGLYTIVLYRFTGVWDWFDVACCVPIGALFGLLVVVLRQVERRSALRYDATATLLMTAVVTGNYLTRIVAPMLILACVCCVSPGCGKSTAPVDAAPFEAAVTKYLAANNMALKLKEIRSGPAIDGRQATMSASMTHRELGGPSVVWTFQFQQSEGGTWTVVSHSDQ